MQHHRPQIEAYLKHHLYELTFERQIMIGILERMPTFDMSEFRAQCLKQNITNQTVYSFVGLLVDAKIILPEVRVPARFNDNSEDISKQLETEPRKHIQNPVVHRRVLRSYL